MDRMACVDIPALPLQLLLVRHPDWARVPAVVVDKDKPQGVILWANARARAYRILPGMRFAAALALAVDLRASIMRENEIAEGVSQICEKLRRFSPEVEPCEDEPGVFWVNASGLGGLYESLSEWGRWVHEDLLKAGFHSHIAVGFTRFGTYAIAKAGFGVKGERGGLFRSKRLGRSGKHKTETASTTRKARAKWEPLGEQGVIVFEDARQEMSCAHRVPLESLDIEPRLRDTLDKLGVRTVGAFLRLPATGIRRRFGAQAYRLHKMATGDPQVWTPFMPRPEELPLEERTDLDHAESNSARLMFLIKRLLHPLLSALAARHEALTVLILRMKLERHEPREECIRTASPTLDARQILGLVHLRLESMDLPSGVEELELAVESVRASTEQLRLFVQQPRRDLRAAGQAFARIRAEFGNGTVVRASLRDGHLPEAGFTWEDFDQPKPPEIADAGEELVMIRRVFPRPVRLPPRPRNEPDGWLLRGEEHGHVVKYIGPYVVSGGWWVNPVHREYHYAQTRDGELVWIYYDRKRRRWFMQGMVE